MRYRIAMVMAWMLTASAAHAQEAEIPTISYAGVHLFCHVLHSNKMTPIASFSEALKDPKQTTIIIFGDPAFLKKIKNADHLLKSFLDKGGSLLIATDHEWTCVHLSIQFSGKPIVTPEGVSKEFCYRGEPECPLLPYVHPDTRWLKITPNGVIIPDVEKGQDFRDHPLFGLLHKKIASNCPSELGTPRGTTPQSDLLAFPFGRYYELGLTARSGFFKNRPLYMAGSPKNAPPAGRALYIAGHGMFINAMMAQTDNDNFEFATNAVRWLREGPKGGPEHSKVLFYVNDEIINHFDMKLTPPLPPIPIPTAEALNRLVRGWENEHFFQKLLADALGENLDRFIAIVLAIVTFIVLIYGAKKFMEGRHHFETTVPILLGPPPVAKTPSEERQQAILRKGDFWEPSRRLALDWLRQEFGVTPDAEVRFQANGTFWPRWRLQRQADFTLQLARTADGSRLSRHQFFLLVETLRELSAAAKDGRLALLVEGKTVKQAFSYRLSVFSQSKPV